MMEEEAGGCRRLHNEEFHKFYDSPNIIRIIKAMMMRWWGRTWDNDKYTQNFS
jgi:hypothetical protein